MKYSYILPIRNRANLLKRGLESLLAMDYDKDEFEVVIADYHSEDNLLEVVHSFRGLLNISLVVIEPKRFKGIYFEKGMCNPALAQNIAVSIAEGKFIILTSPEIIHWNKNLKELDILDEYINLEKKFMYGHVIEMTEQELFNANRNDVFQTLDKTEVTSGEKEKNLCNWNLKKSITVYFHGVLSKKIFMDIGGIDLRYMQGIAYEDEDFANRISRCGKVDLEYCPKTHSVHLTHDRSYQHEAAIAKNRHLLDSKKENWGNEIIANKGKKIGDLDSVIELAKLYRF